MMGYALSAIPIFLPFGQASPSSPLQTVLGTLQSLLFNAQGLSLIGLFLVLAVASRLSSKRGRLTSARWATASDKLNAVRRAFKQIRSSKINDVCLWCGSPPKWQTQHVWPFLITRFTGAPPSLYIPDANQSAVIVGRPKSGKTFSAINPMLKSAIEQGMAILLYDYKADDNGNGGQMAYIATLAARHHYTIHVFSPGRPYSCVINPLDFLTDENDDTTAAVLAEVFHANLKGGGKGREDAFFGPAGQRLIQALFQFAKATQYPDIAMAFSLVRLTNLPERLVYADARGQLPMAVRIAFSQLMQTTGAERTTSGITATASDVLTRFMSSRILPALMGRTNISIELGKKELIVFHSDIFRQDVMNPLIAALINVIINRNFAIQRRVPLVFSADEFPTLYLPKCPTWPNEHRSKGFVGLFGYQSFPQIEDAYGKDKANILLSGVGTHFWFNPGNQETAKHYSSYLGEIETTFQTKSWSNSRGSEWGRDRSSSEQVRTRALVLPDDFLRYGTGECIVINPAYQSQNQSNLPQHFRQIRIPSADIKIEQHCEAIWNQTLRAALTKRESRRRSALDLEHQLQLRMDEANRLLP